MVDLDVAYRFRKTCEHSNSILQSFIDSTDETIEYSDHISTKDSRVLVNSDTGLYEYRPPDGLNVKLVKNDRGLIANQNPTRKINADQRSSTHTIFLKSEPLDEEILDEEEEEEDYDILYETDANYDDTSIENEKETTIVRKSVQNKTTLATATTTANDTKLMQIKPVRTNKVRLGYTSANKGKNSTSSTVKTKVGQHSSKENVSSSRTNKNRSNAKEPKQPKKCEICGNTYMYQHALER